MKDRATWLKRIKGLKNYKKSNKEADELGSKLPDSMYDAIIQSAKLADSGKGKPQIVVAVKVVDDEEYADEVVSVYMGLSDTSDKADNKAPLVFTINTLKRLGFELGGEDPAEILDAVEELDGSKMRIKLRVSNGYTNINGLAEEGGEESSEEGSEETGEEEESEEKEETEETEEETTGEVIEGAKVSWTGSDGSELEGTVIEVLEDNNIARVEKSNGKITRVPIDKLTVGEAEEVEASEEEEEQTESEEGSEEEEEVAEKPAKKTTKKVVKKKKTARK